MRKVGGDMLTVEKVDTSSRKQVNRFIAENGVKKVISISDTTTTDNTGATMGLIRVLAYET